MASEAPELTTIKLRTSTLSELRDVKKLLNLKSVKETIAYLVSYFKSDQATRTQSDVQVQLAQLREDVYTKMDKIHQLLEAQAGTAVHVKPTITVQISDLVKPDLQQTLSDQFVQILKDATSDGDATIR